MLEAAKATVVVLLVGLEADTPPPAQLSSALAELWQVIGPLRHARMAR